LYLWYQLGWSTYYDRKKEAVMLFGMSLWGNAIPMLKEFLATAREDKTMGYEI